MYHFLITDTGKDREHTDSEEFDQNSPTTLKEDATKYRQASTNPPELLTSRPSSSDDENITEDASASGLTSESRNNSKPQHFNVLEAEKDDLNDPR